MWSLDTVYVYRQKKKERQLLMKKITMEDLLQNAGTLRLTFFSHSDERRF